MNSQYPSSPTAVPRELTRPTPRYMLKVWQAVLILLLFMACYLGLSGWFLLKSYQLFSDPNLATVIGGSASLFLGIFMLKALFFSRPGGQIDDIEIHPQEHPDFFAFLNRLADETGAPRPRRVYLSSRVNAAVFYDLSIINLFWPSRKNLEIGLALVNVLTVAEFKAVLAHEFGHFAQRSMALGRWVYIAQQIAGQLIAKRDAFDNFLKSMSYTDPRIAWIAWILSLIVWAIRSLLELLFRVVVLAQRSLSREMELQADLVAVAVSGSDALVHALHKMDAADDAWGRTLAFANEEFAKERQTADLFAIQSRAIALVRTILADPHHGQPPEIPLANPAEHRVFTPEFAQPPQMWATHPLSHEREANAKRIYIRAELNETSAWSLFSNPQALRERMTLHIFRNAKEQKPVPDIAESLQNLEQYFQRKYYDPAYRGAYVHRSPVRHAHSYPELYLESAPFDPQYTLSQLYPDALFQQLAQLRRLEREETLLQSLIDRHTTPPDGILRFRGQQVKRRDLPKLMRELKAEVAEMATRVANHDRLCRTVHLKLAEKLGNGWPEYLRGLAAILHYADHTRADLEDARRALNTTVAAATAGRRISGDGRAKVMRAANHLYGQMDSAKVQSMFVTLDEELLRRTDLRQWRKAFAYLELSIPQSNWLGEWLDNVDGWLSQLTGPLDMLYKEALECLLLAEERVAQMATGQAETESAPAASEISRFDYPVLTPGNERKPDVSLSWWDRFMAAEGSLATAARLLVAGSIVGLVLGMGTHVSDNTVTAYNGLATPVDILVNGNTHRLDAGMATVFSIPADYDQPIITRAANGALIENFTPDIGKANAHYFYNVASASPLVEWTASYGVASTSENRPLGTPRWGTTVADDIFREPPAQVSSKSGTTRNVLSGVTQLIPQDQLGMVSSPEEQAALIKTHLRWDEPDSPMLAFWLISGTKLPEFQTLIEQRLARYPSDVMTLRARQDSQSGTARDKVCAEDKTRAQAMPANGSLHYLAIRCLPDAAERNQAYLTATKRWPDNGWLAMAAGYTLLEQDNWKDASDKFSVALRTTPALREYLGTDALRIRRMAKLDETPEDPERTSSAVQHILKFESFPVSSEGIREMVNDGRDAYAFLQAGTLDNVAERVETHADRARLLRLLAASEGAKPEWIKKAFELDGSDKADSDTLPLILGLAARQKLNRNALLAQLKQTYPKNYPAFVALLTLADKQDFAGMDKILITLQPYAQGEASAMLTVMLEANTPTSIRERAKRLLFASERPYFK